MKRNNPVPFNNCLHFIVFAIKTIRSSRNQQNIYPWLRHTETVNYIETRVIKSYYLHKLSVRATANTVEMGNLRKFSHTF